MVSLCHFLGVVFCFISYSPGTPGSALVFNKQAAHLARGASPLGMEEYTLFCTHSLTLYMVVILPVWTTTVREGHILADGSSGNHNHD